MRTGESDITTIDVTVPGSRGRNNNRFIYKAFDPSTIEDSKWTLALNSETVSYYIADGKADKCQ
ncbi:MAG: hypothetical protein ACLUR5_19285 [Eubacterium ventriosum]